MPMSDRAARLAYSKQYYRQNRERMLAEQKERDALREAAQPGARAQYQQEYRAAKREQLLEAQRVRSRENYASNKAAYRARQRRQRVARYGLTPEQLTAILQRQEHQCPICQRFLSEATVPSIDHCHVTNSVRGVLCRRCNSALGMLEESPSNVERALEYLSMSRLQAFRSWLSGVTSTPNKTP
ncbi:endonuclease VII domain-containing protein [Variovorax sp.]|uniref:endonuclease VII domain-containing protein n=1 Tax=Variovorax sp. TaxID=1871043 RepID=UPI003BABB1A4